MPTVNLGKRRVREEPAIAEEVPAYKRIEGEVAMEGCHLVIQGEEKNVHILLRSVLKEKTPDGKGTAYCYTGRVAEKKSGKKTEFFRLQRSELCKLTGMELDILNGFKPNGKAYVVQDKSRIAKEVPLEAIDKMVDCFVEFVGKQTDIIEHRLKRNDAHVKAGFNHLNDVMHDVIAEVRAGF